MGNGENDITWPYYPQPGSQTEMWECLNPYGDYEYVGFGGPRGGGKCLSPNELVELADGNVRKVKDIKKGDLVLSFNEQGNIEPRRVAELFRSKPRDFYKIITTSGLQLMCAYTHKLKTDLGWKSTENLSQGDTIAIARGGGFGNKSAHPDLLRLYGLLLGDGSLKARGHTARIGSIYPEFHRQIEHLCDKAGYGFNWFEDNSESPDRNRTRPIRYYDISGDLKATIRSDGNAVGSGDKFVPPWIKMQAREGVVAFLSHLFATDGWVTVGKKRSEIGFATTSRQMGQDVLFLLRKFGIVGRMRKRKNKRYDKEYGDMWQLAIKDKHYVQKFIDEIGIFGKRHNEKLDKIVRRYDGNNSISGGGDYLPVSLTKDITTLDIPASKKDGTSSIKKRLRGKTSRTRMQRETVRRFASGRDNAEELLELAENDIYWDEIKSIEFIGRQKGYDFEVEGNHNYIANGIVSHNSYGMRSFFATLCSQMPVHCVIVRQELEDLKRNHIEPMKQELKPFIDRNIIRYNTQNKEFIFPNGAKLGFMYCKTDADLNRFQGLGIDLLGLEEAGQFTKAQMAYMISSVRPSPIANQANTHYPPRVLFTFNWGGPGHKYLRRIFWDGQPQPHVGKDPDYSYYRDGEDPEDYHFIFAPFSENKKLQEADPNYQDKLRLLSEKLQKAYIDGDPDAFTGTFFNVAKYVHEVEPFEIPSSWSLFGALDPGTASHCSFGLYAKSPDGQIVKIYNYYQEKTTPVEHARNIKDLLTYDERVVQWTGGRMPSYVVAGKDAFAKQNRYQIHAHEYTWADIFQQEAGLGLIPCNNARVPGATAVLQVLSFKYDYEADDEATDIERILEYPKLRFFEGQCSPTIEELVTLEHDERNPDDVAQGLGIEDHAYDETRYAIMSAVRPMRYNFSETNDFSELEDYGRHRSEEEAMEQAVGWDSLNFSDDEDENSWEQIY